MRVLPFLACPAALGMLLAPALAGTAAAAPPIPTSGSYTATGTGGTPPEGPGNATFFEFSNATTSSGSFTGTGGSDFQCVLVGTKFFRCHGEQFFTGTVTGVDGTGTLTSRVLLTCEFATDQCVGKSVSIAGTDALAGVHSSIESRSRLSVSGGTYTGKLVLPGG